MVANPLPHGRDSGRVSCMPLTNAVPALELRAESMLLRTVFGVIGFLKIDLSLSGPWGH
jgi:hypothetical protein